MTQCPIKRLFLRNESNIFSVDRGFNQKKKRDGKLQTFSVLFSVDLDQPKKKY